MALATTYIPSVAALLFSLLACTTHSILTAGSQSFIENLTPITQTSTSLPNYSYYPGLAVRRDLDNRWEARIGFLGVLWVYWTNFLCQSWVMWSMVAEIWLNHWKPIMLGILNNELINNPHIVDEKCSQTSITYPPSFTFHFWHLYMNPQAVFLFLRVLCGSLQCYFTQLKNGLINRVGHGEQNYRGRFITYFPGLGLIFMVHDRLGISYYQFL